MDKKEIRELSLKYDTGFIGATIGGDFKRRSSLLNELLAAEMACLSYGIVKINGSSIEDYETQNAKEVGDNLYFIIDHHNKGDLKTDLMILGEKFNQESVLFVHKGGVDSELIGTVFGKRFIGYRHVRELKDIVFDESGNFQARVDGRPFILGEPIGELRSACNIMGRMGARAESNDLKKKIDKLKWLG